MLAVIVRSLRWRVARLRKSWVRRFSTNDGFSEPDRPVGPWIGQSRAGIVWSQLPSDTEQILHAL